MMTALNLATITVFASCARGASCNDVFPSPLFIAGVLLGVIALVFLAKIVRSRSRD